MEIDAPGASNGGNTGVEANTSGEGRPYAPENWPNPGDNWRWKSGSSTRITSKGFYQDRFLYPPSGLQGCTTKCFKSEKSVKAYIREAFPDRDVKAFSASFTWHIPAKDEYVQKAVGSKNKSKKVVSPVKVENPGPYSKSEEGEVCKGKNNLCITLLEPYTSSSELMACDICCSEPGFCRECCCILCGKHVIFAYGGYSFIKCEAAMENGTICGHIAHIDCALRSHMGGTVGGSINLDAEYYCRRCDNITDFIPHVSKILRSCESVESLEDIKTVISVGSSVLIGSQKTRAKELLDRIEVAMAKLKDGVSLRNLWKAEGVSSDITVDEMEAEKPSLQGSSRKFDLRTETIKLEDEIDKTLHAMRSAQRAELRIADDALHAQKNFILNLYQKLDQERHELNAKTSSEISEPLLKAIREREDQIKVEVEKLRDMQQVAKGFVMTPKEVLEKHFGLKIDR